MNGTSVAAPAITRKVACMLAKGAPGDRPAVRLLAVPLPFPHQTAERCGAGAIILPPLRPLPRFDP
jgi:hypothetical protein